MAGKPNPIYAVGTIHPTNQSGDLIVEKYVSAIEVHVRFLTTGFTKVVRTDLIKGKRVYDPYYPSVSGVGFIGEGDYQASHNGKHTSTYSRWASMLGRCYNVNDVQYYMYGAKGVRVNSDWFNFQAYAEWYYSECGKLGIDPENNEYHIDKDIGSVDGYECYSPSNCTLVLPQPNIEKACAKYYSFIDPEGNAVKVYNLSKFCRENGLNGKCLNSVWHGHKKQYKGWVRAVAKPDSF